MGGRTALLLSAGLTLVDSITVAMTDTIWVIIAGRAIQGLGAASGYVVSRAIVRDIYGAARAMAILFALMAACFMAALLIGGALLEISSWRAGFWFASTAALVRLAIPAHQISEEFQRCAFVPSLGDNVSSTSPS